MISYIGGKYRQAKWIEDQLPKGPSGPADIKVYGEVFGGAYWNYIKGDFQCEEAHYNDVNRFMTNLFACCQNYEEFRVLVDSVEPQDRDLFDQYKEELRCYMDPEAPTYPIPHMEIGQKYVYLVTQIFSGIMSEKAKMVDLKGKYKSKYLSFSNRLHNPKVCQRLSKIQAHNLSYEEFIPLIDSDETVLYIDPPYYGTESLYAFHSFGLKDHENLANMMKECKSKWLLSYYEFPDLEKWFPKDQYRWEYKEFKKASMATKGGKQSVGTEVLVMNY